MPRVCPQCGEWCVKELIDDVIPAVLCPFCQYAEPFVRLPLFIITGASGTGKTALSQHLPAHLPECVTLDTDILWGVVPATEEKNYSDYQNIWLQLARNIAQNGRPVVLCGSTTSERISLCSQRHYFSAVHIMALVCDGEILLERLKRRPTWRDCDNEETQTNMLNFNRWFQEQANQTEPPMTLYDTSHVSIEQTIQAMRAWVCERLPVVDGR